MFQQLGALPTLAEELNSVPSMHFWQFIAKGPNYSSGESDTPFWPPQERHSPVQTHTQTNVYTLNIKSLKILTYLFIGYKAEFDIMFAF